MEKRKLNMQCIIMETAKAVENYAGNYIFNQLQKEHARMLALATGNTTEPIYRLVVQQVLREGLLLHGCTFSALDEYRALESDSPLGCRYRLARIFVDAGVLEEKQLLAPDDEKGFDKRLEALGQFDLAVLGVGANGHIAFNEMGSKIGQTTHTVVLSEETRQGLEKKYRKRGLFQPIPRMGITLGMKTILQSKQILLLAKGGEKAEVVKALVEGPVTEELPASLLQVHPQVLVVLDKQAASLLVR